MYPASQTENSSVRKNGAFLSSTKRFSKPRDVIIKQTSRHNPGPGKYEVKGGTVPGGTLVCKESRFKDGRKDEIPGPGAYEVR